MSNTYVLDLADCTQFRQTVAARPPRVVHGTVLLLSALLLTVLLWGYLTEADLVVRAAGRVRPLSTPVKIVSGARAEVLSGSHAGRVLEVGAREGDQVHKGQVLIRLDTGRLDNDIEACQRRLAAGEEEIARLDRLAELLALQFAVTRQKAEAELAEAEEEIRTAQERRSTETRLAEAEVHRLEHQVAIQDQLAAKRVVTDSELAKVRHELKAAQAELAKCRLPVNEGRLPVLRQVLDLAVKQHDVEREELASRRAARLTETEAVRIELENLLLERDSSMLRAPIDGVVIVGDVKVGDFLEPNKPAMEIAETGGFRFEALVPTEEVAHVRPGMPARIKLDAYDYQRYGTIEGSVDFVAPDSEPYADSHVHAYVVRIAVSSEIVGRDDASGRVKLGMAGSAEIVTEQRSVLSLLIKKVRRSISLG